MPSMPDTPPFEPLLAGALALLHHQAVRDTGRPPCPYSAQKLSLNLRRLADHPAISEALATVLQRLSRDWSQRAVDARCADDADDAPPAAAHRLH